MLRAQVKGKVQDLMDYVRLLLHPWMIKTSDRLDVIEAKLEKLDKKICQADKKGQRRKN